MKKGKDARGEQSKPGALLALEGIGYSHRPAVARFHAVEQPDHDGIQVNRHELPRDHIFC